MPKARLLPHIAHICMFLAFGLLGSVAGQQSPPAAPQPQNQSTSSQSDPAQASRQSRMHRFGQTHILWIFPNYRAEESEMQGALTPRAKFKVAFADSFDPSAFLVAGAFAGISMAQVQYPAFGQGAQGYAKYYGGAFADQAIGNFMTEAIFPTALNQDPRYFVKGKGGFWRRTRYALSREVITRGDEGGNQFNTSELAGNAVAAGISNLYYPAADRTFGKTANKWGQQIGLDAFFNVMKEFWPDVRQRVFHTK